MVKRPADDSDGIALPSKRQEKTPNSDMDPRKNLYLAHQYADEDEEQSQIPSNGFGNGLTYNKSRGHMAGAGSLASFSKHATTAKMAAAAEDGPQNPFNGQQLSDQYFRILKTRRDLPVHAQR